MPLQQSLSENHFSLPPFRFQKHFKLFAAVVCGGLIIGVVSLYKPTNIAEYYLFTALQLLLFSGLGFYFNNCQHKISKQETLTLNNQLRFILFVGLSICGLLGLLYVFFKDSRIIMAFAGSAAFILPFFVQTGWFYFNEIPKEEYKIWIPEKRIENTASIFLDCLSVKLKLAQKLHDLHDNFYPVHIPYYMKLGDFFSRFMSEQNKNPSAKVEDTDEKKERYAWEFFSIDKYSLQNKRLDPNKNLVENKVKQGAVVHAKRLYESVKLLTYQKQNLL